MQIGVKVRPEDVSDILAGESERPEVSRLLQMIRDAGVALKPMHPGVSDPELRTWFSAEVSGEADIQELAERLRQQKPILAAYPKPKEEPP